MERKKELKRYLNNNSIKYFLFALVHNSIITNWYYESNYKLKHSCKKLTKFFSKINLYLLHKTESSIFLFFDLIFFFNHCKIIYLFFIIMSVIQ